MRADRPTLSRGRTQTGFPPRPRRLAGLLAACLFAAGCRGLGKPDTRYDLLTAELRTRTRELEEARAELQQLRLLNQVYQRQGQPGVCVSPAYRADAPVLPLRNVALGAGTGGVDEDGRPGDESLMVVVVPRDNDGAAIKVPARLAVTACEISPAGIKTPIGQWDVSPDQLRRTWRGGLFSTGYFVPLQWDKAPTTDRLRVSVRFVTLDNKEYEADKDVTVRPLAGFAPPAAVPEGPPPSAEELPPPAARLLPPKVIPEQHP